MKPIHPKDDKLVEFSTSEGKIIEQKNARKNIYFLNPKENSNMEDSRNMDEGGVTRWHSWRG